MIDPSRDGRGEGFGLGCWIFALSGVRLVKTWASVFGPKPTLDQANNAATKNGRDNGETSGNSREVLSGLPED